MITISGADELEATKRKAAQLAADLAASLDRERALRTQLRTVATGTDGVWFWQGDGHDDPGSLSCPVVMSADRLRAFVAAGAEVEALRHVEATARAWGVALQERRHVDAMRALEALYTTLGFGQMHTNARLVEEADALREAAQRVVSLRAQGPAKRSEMHDAITALAEAIRL